MAEKVKIQIQRPTIQRPTIQRPQKAAIQRPMRVPPGMMAPDFDSLFEPDDADPLGGLTDTGDIEENATREVDIVLDELLAQRRAQKERWRTTNDDEFWVAVCFQSRQQKEDFLQRAGWEQFGDKYLDGLRLAAHLGVSIEPVLLEKPKAVKKSPQKGGESV